MAGKKKYTDPIKELLEHATRSGGGYNYDGECVVRIKMIPKSEIKAEIKEEAEKTGITDLDMTAAGSYVVPDRMTAAKYIATGGKVFVGKLYSSSTADWYIDVVANGEHFFFTRHVAEIEIQHEPVVLSVDSLSQWEFVFNTGSDVIDVGCESISREDAKTLFEHFGEWLGYDIS